MNQSIPTFAIYMDAQGQPIVEVLINQDSIWLNLQQIAHLFERDKSVISRHIKNIFQAQEVQRSSVVANFATAGADQKTYQVDYYNLDMIISLGYRVNSRKAVQFRRWATSVLQNHLLKGYTLNPYRLKHQGTDDIQQALRLLQQILINQNLNTDDRLNVIHLIQNYAQSWTLLLQYDEEQLKTPSATHSPQFSLNYNTVKEVIEKFKQELINKKEAAQMFGQEKDHGLQAILGNIEQTFDGYPLYASTEERAAHLLYFIIKDHPFNDGNKRIGCLLFLIYLQLNNMCLQKLTDTALVALALLIADSHPQEKDLIIHLVINLITN